jgi:O-acetyl-ADP-ribose deacetylase (regulator of RNase III)
MRRQVGSVVVESTKGDIAAQPDLAAVVNAANPELMPGGGVAGAIHRAAGPGLAKECKSLAPIRPGQAVITGGHGLANRHVIHCLGPVYGRDESAADLLANCYRNALDLADRHGVESVGFPAISTGVFRYPPAEAAAIAVGTVVARAATLKVVRQIRFVLFDDASLKLHEAALECLTDPAPRD